MEVLCCGVPLVQLMPVEEWTGVIYTRLHYRVPVLKRPGDRACVTILPRGHGLERAIGIQAGVRLHRWQPRLRPCVQSKV